MIPVGTLAVIMNADLAWNNALSTITFIGDGFILPIQVGVPLPNDMGTPMMSNETIYIPFAYAAEILGAELHWYERTGATYLFLPE